MEIADFGLLVWFLRVWVLKSLLSARIDVNSVSSSSSSGSGDVARCIVFIVSICVDVEYHRMMFVCLRHVTTSTLGKLGLWES